MSRYFFDIVNNQGYLADDEGVEIVDPSDIQNIAARIIVDLASDEVKREVSSDITVKVRDQSDRLRFIAKLNYATEWIE